MSTPPVQPDDNRSTRSSHRTVLPLLDSPERFLHESRKNTEMGSASRYPVPASSPMSIGNLTTTSSLGPNRIQWIHNEVAPPVSETVTDHLREEVKTLFDSLRDGLYTDVNSRLQEDIDVALPGAVRKTVTKKVPAMVNSELSETVPTMASCSLGENLPGLVADQVGVVIAAMPQQTATVSRRQFHPFLQLYLEQRLPQHQGHPVLEQQEVVPQRTVPA